MPHSTFLPLSFSPYAEASGHQNLQRGSCNTGISVSMEWVLDVANSYQAKYVKPS